MLADEPRHPQTLPGGGLRLLLDLLPYLDMTVAYLDVDEVSSLEVHLLQPLRLFL